MLTKSVHEHIVFLSLKINWMHSPWATDLVSIHKVRSIFKEQQHYHQDKIIRYFIPFTQPKGIFQTHYHPKRATP